MKNFLLLLVFASTLSFAQEPLPVIDHNVQETFDHLVDLSASHGKDYLGKLKAAGFTGIFVVESLPDNKLASYKRSGNSFHINVTRLSLADKTSLEWTLAHELGHGLGLLHETPPLPDGSYSWSAEIMSGSGTIDPGHLVYQIMVHPKYSPGIWNRYFSQL